MAGSSYEADTGGMRDAMRVFQDLADAAAKLGPKFESGLSATRGWTGNDSFGKVMAQQVRDDESRTTSTANSVGGAVGGVAGGIKASRDSAEGTQDDALNAIHGSGEGGTAGGTTGGRH